MLIDGAIRALAKKFKLDKVLSYVENDNELDYKVKSMENRILMRLCFLDYNKGTFYISLLFSHTLQLTNDSRLLIQ